MPDPTEPRERALRLEPVQTDDRRAILSGCLVWFIALTGCVVFRHRLQQQGRGWWIWVCVAGLVLGMLGVAYLQTHGRWGRRQEPPAT